MHTTCPHTEETTGASQPLGVSVTIETGDQEASALQGAAKSDPERLEALRLARDRRALQVCILCGVPSHNIFGYWGQYMDGLCNECFTAHLPRCCRLKSTRRTSCSCSPTECTATAYAPAPFSRHAAIQSSSLPGLMHEYFE